MSLAICDTIYTGDFGNYVVPAPILAAAGVTSPRSVWDMRYTAARCLKAWGQWMDLCEAHRES